MKQKLLAILEPLESTLEELEEQSRNEWDSYDQAYYDGASEGLSLAIEQIKKILTE